MKFLFILSLMICGISFAVGALIWHFDYDSINNFSLACAINIIMSMLSATFWLLMATFAYFVKYFQNVKKELKEEQTNGR